jgi:hypothetical protein
MFLSLLVHIHNSIQMTLKQSLVLFKAVWLVRIQIVRIQLGHRNWIQESPPNLPVNVMAVGNNGDSKKTTARQDLTFSSTCYDIRRG